MISTKVGTQSFSKAVQEHNFGDDHNVHYEAAHADPPKTEKGQGSGNGTSGVGDYLNGVANPGGKNPNLHVRRAHNTLDKDDFLKLMLTQMKNQDPMNPLQSHEMAAQLAQFTSLEQLFNVNKNLENLQHAQDPVQKYEALNFLGKTIKADTRQLMRQTADERSELRFNLGMDATKVKVTISDEMGSPVKTLEFGMLKKGPNKVAWNGLNDKDQETKPGKFTFNVEAENKDGKKIAVSTETSGTITGINYSSEGPMLMVGDQKVRLQDVQRIEDDGLKERQELHDAIQLQSGGNAAVPEEVLKNLGPQAKGQSAGGEQAGGSPNSRMSLQSLFDGPQPIQHAQDKKRVKPEDKPEAKLSGAVLPLEVASSNAAGLGHVGSGSGINLGGAFARK